MALTDTLTKQVGPLPAWGWGVVVVGGYVVYRVVRGGGASAQAAQAGVPVDLSGTTTDGGAGSSTAGPPTTIDTSGLQALIGRLSSLVGAGGGTGGAIQPVDTTGTVTQVAGPSFVAPTSPSEPGTATPITITTLANDFGQIVTSGPAITTKQLAEIAKTGALPTGLSYGTARGPSYPISGSIMPSSPVDLSGPSGDVATYLQQLYAIEAGAKIDPSVWPSEAVNAAQRKAQIAQLAGSILASGPTYYGANYGGLTTNQIRYAANIANPFTSGAQGYNPVIQTALINAANNPKLLTNVSRSGAPPTITHDVQRGSPGVSAPSTSKPLLTLSEFNAINRAATIERLNAAKGAQNISTADVNRQIAANYEKYKQARS